MKRVECVRTPISHPARSIVNGAHEQIPGSFSWPGRSSGFVLSCQDGQLDTCVSYWVHANRLSMYTCTLSHTASGGDTNVSIATHRLPPGKQASRCAKGARPGWSEGRPTWPVPNRVVAVSPIAIWCTMCASCQRRWSTAFQWVAGCNILPAQLLGGMHDTANVIQHWVFPRQLKAGRTLRPQAPRAMLSGDSARGHL